MSFLEQIRAFNRESETSEKVGQIKPKREDSIDRGRIWRRRVFLTTPLPALSDADYSYDPSTFPSIRNFIRVYPPEDRYSAYKLESKSKVVDKGQRICFLKKMEKFFTSEDLAALQQEFSNTRPARFDSNSANGFLDRAQYISTNNDATEIFFEKGRISSSTFFGHDFYDHASPVVQKAMRIVLERVAAELNLDNGPIKINCSAFKSEITADNAKLCVLPWHTDSLSEGKLFDFSHFNAETSDFSLVIMLSDREAADGWQGGNLLYTGRRKIAVQDVNEWPKEMRKIADKTHNHVLNDPSFPTWEIEYSVNDGLLFGNRLMNHFVTPIIPKTEVATRIIINLALKINTTSDIEKL